MMTRRTFMERTAIASATMAAGVSAKAAGANDRIVVGVMGINDRGMDLAEQFAKRDDVELRYFADPDSRLFPSRVKFVENINGQRPRCVQDFRRILDDPEIDAIAIAAPDHWHALATVMACQAGKDVYVEKPTSHSVWESRKMVDAARKYERVVQVGTQNRSAEYCRMAFEYVRSGALGDIHFVRVMNSKLRDPLEPHTDEPAPEGVDYDMWLGPAPKRPYNENRFHYHWHWFWEYGGGDVCNDGVHQTDLARWMTGRTLPKTVSSTGGLHVFNDGRDAPDTQCVNWQFDGLTMVLEQTLWTPYMRKTPFELRDTDQLPNWPFSGTRVEIYGTKDFMFLGRMGGGWQVFNGDGDTVKIQPGRFAPANEQHIANFIECMRTRERPNADIEEGHYSTLLTHYGNIAYRVGRTLAVNAETEGIVGDDEANALVKREYREPWVVPDQV